MSSAHCQPDAAGILGLQVGKDVNNLNVRCQNRPPYLDMIVVQNGWRHDGTRKMVSIPAVNSKSCRYEQRGKDVGCAGCRWQHQDDPRDTKPVVTSSPTAPQPAERAHG